MKAVRLLWQQLLPKPSEADLIPKKRPKQKLL